MNTGRQKGLQGNTVSKMSPVNLLIMGLLMDRSLSAYDLAQIVETQIFGRLVKISSPAVYKNVKELSRGRLPGDGENKKRRDARKEGLLHYGEWSGIFLRTDGPFLQ